MAGRTEGLGHRARGAEEEEGVAAHVAGDDDRLPERAEMRGERRMARAEGARRALAVHAHALPPAVDRVLLELGDVVADVVDEPEAQRGGPEAEGGREGPLGEAAHHLPVRPGEVRGRRHGGEVLLPLGRAERHAGELAVGHADPVARHGASHGAERVVAHLVAEPARPGMDHDRHLARRETECRGGAHVVHLVHALDLEEVVPGAERADLAPPALERRLRHGVGVRVAEAAALLRRLQVGGPAELARHRPRRAAREHLLLLGPGELRDRALGADAGRDRLIERVRDAREVRPEIVRGERGAQQAHAAVDVEADAAGRDRALLRVDRGHAADREAVAPVDVRHGERAADDPGQVGHVRELRERRIVPQLRHELLARVDPAGHAHAALARDLPDVVADPLELHDQTSRMMRAHHPPAVSRSASWW